MVLLIRQCLLNGNLRKNSSWHGFNPHKREAPSCQGDGSMRKIAEKNKLILCKAFQYIGSVPQSWPGLTRIPDSRKCLSSFLPSALFDQRTCLFRSNEIFTLLIHLFITYGRLNNARRIGRVLHIKKTTESL